MFKKLLSVLLTCLMIVSILPSGLSGTQTQAAATWRSALYPENWEPGYTNSSGQFLHDFSYAGYEKGEKDLPTEMSGKYANVVDYGADATGTNDSTSAIQSAINAVEAAGGGTVYLPEGTFKVKPSSNEYSAALRIKGSNILFKGAGVGKTFIRCYAENMRYCQVINVSPNGATWDSADDGKTYYLTQDVPEAPTTTIHVNDVSNFKKGDWVIIRSNRTSAWINEHGMSGFWSESVNASTMGVTFYRQITSVNISAKTVEIDIPTRYYMKTRDNARIYKVSPKQSNVGLSDFSIGNKSNSNSNGWGEEDYKTSGTGAYNTNNAFLIKFSLNINCFAKNIATYQAGNASRVHMSSNGLDINKTRNLTVDSCDFSHPQYEGGGGNGYGMNICGQETLIKDCSSTSARHSFSFKYSYANGNVIYHYTSTDPKYGSDFHMYLSMSNLIDNEELNGDFVESNVRPYGGTAGNRHGYTSTQTVFWNTKGNRYKSGNNYIIDSRQYGYGYIIGTQGAATAVKTTPITMSSQYGTVNTAPEDYKEGIGTGSTLSPQSLYYDQLAKRLGGSTEPPAVTNQIPGTVSVGAYTSKSDGITFNKTGDILYAGNLNSNSYLDYTINAAESGSYQLNFKFAAGNTQWNAKNMLIKLDDRTVATVPVQGSTDWEIFIDHTVTINITSAGQHKLSIVADGGSCNVADFTAQKVDDFTTEQTTQPEEIATLPQENITTSANRVVGYLPSYRSGTINSIDFSALTHCVLSFMTYANGTLTSGFDAGTTQNIVNKCHQNDVKALIAIGGGGGFNTSDNPFGTAAKRTSIVNQIMNYVTQNNLDGVDIDIEVSDANTWSNFDSFISELSGRLKAQNKLLTMAVSSWFTGSIQNSTYNYFDFINLMTYDENAGNGPVASMNFVNNQLSHYRSKGIGDDRLVIGVPFYGYGPGGYSDAFTYAEILSANVNNRWSDTATVNGKTVYYNGENTIKEKAELSKSYGGIMIWELGQDSFGSNSLLKVIKDTVSTGTGVKDPTITDVPGTVAVDAYVSKSSNITMNTGGTKYAGNLKDGSTLDYYIRVQEKGTYTFKLKLAAGDAQWNAKNMLIKLNNQTTATIPVQESSGWENFVEHTAEIAFPARGEYKISLTAEAGAVNVADFTVTKHEETTTEPSVSKEMYIEMNGHQISTTLGGFRTVYSVYDPNDEVSEVGLVYGLGKYATENEMTIDSQSKYVTNHKGTIEIGRLDNFTFGDNPDASSYAMTMTFGNVPADFYGEKMMVRAYAKMKDGSVSYTAINTTTIYDVADVLYQNRKMTNKDSHDYLYQNILSKVQPSYKEVDYDWGTTIVKTQ